MPFVTARTFIPRLNIRKCHPHLAEILHRPQALKNPEALTLSTDEVGDILRSGGVSDAHVEAFAKSVEAEFGEDAALMPTNLVDGKFEIVTPEVKITMSPEYSDMVETRIINGRKYILIPADDGMEVNGVAVTIQQ